MATNKLEIVLNRIKTGIGKCSNRADVETLVNEATEYSLNNKQVQTIVDALCDKYNVGEFQGTDEKLEKLVEYLESLDERLTMVLILLCWLKQFTLTIKHTVLSQWRKQKQ